MTVNPLGASGPDLHAANTTPSQTTRESGVDRSMSMAVIEAVEAATGTDALDLPPLLDVIDPDALDALVRSADRSLRVEFEYCGRTVVVRGDGRISVTGSDER